MFTLTHFLWLSISFLIVAFLLFITKKLKMNNENCLTLMVILKTSTEILKIFLEMKQSDKGGFVLDPHALPFHLCTVQIIFIYALKFVIKKENVRRILFNFMVPSSLVGATLSLLIPTKGTSFTSLYVYQYYLSHSFLIFYGLYLLRERLAILDFKATLNNLALLLVFVLFDLWVNSILSVYDTNFMYLTRPPMENLPLLNLDHGWGVYFITLIGLGFVLMALFHLPFILVEKKKKALN